MRSFASPTLEIQAAYTREEVAPALQREPFDLWLTDRIGLPIVDTIKQSYPKLPIVVYSGMHAPAELPIGVARWLQKPSLPELKALFTELSEKEREKDATQK